MSEQSPYRPRCQNLCCKAMVVYGESFADAPDYHEGSSDFWCIRTAKGHGPDDEGVSLSLCSDPLRECFQEY
ncbi:MAG TPA: hypothetical protein VN688_31070 [Gemmataceae bacterium]|nr:hypothetical protein [Gemmataceae bacterium]